VLTLRELSLMASRPVLARLGRALELLPVVAPSVAPLFVALTPRSNQLRAVTQVTLRALFAHSLLRRELLT
jgi:hypothetical protein